MSTVAEEHQDNPFGVEVGQVWVSTDKRAIGIRQTVIEIKHGKARMSGEFRKSWVRLDRFKPGSSGLRRLS